MKRLAISMEQEHKSTRGGARAGAGRKKGDKKQIAFWINEEEKEYLLKCLAAYRKMKEAENGRA